MIEGAVEPRAFLFYGADSYRVHQAVHSLLQRWVPQAANAVAGLNIQRLDGDTLTPDTLRTACWTPPFLGDLRIVVVRGLLGRWGAGRGRRGQGDAALNEWREALKKVVDIPPFTRLVFWEGELKVDHPLLQVLQSREPFVQVQAFERLSYHDMARFLESEAQARGLTLASDALNALVERTWPDLWVATSALDKLALLFPRQVITQRQLEAAVGEGGMHAFRLLDALFAGDTARALALLHSLVRQGEGASAILALLGRELRTLAIAGEMRSQGASLGALQEALGLPEGRVRQVLRRAEHMSLSRVASFYERLLRTDLAIKEGLQDEEVALTTLVVELCRTAA